VSTAWQTASLGDVCDLITRGIAPNYVESGGVLVLNQKCVRGHAINFDLGRRHDERKKRVATDRFIQLGDGLINSTGTGTLGRVAQVRTVPPEPTTVDTHVSIVRPKDGLFYRDYFGYALQFIEPEFVASGEGASGQTELSRQAINAKRIAFPTSREEQRRIVAILDETFEAVSMAVGNAEEKIAMLGELKATLLSNAFNGKLR